MIKIDDTNLLDFYEDCMIAYNGVVHYCQFCPSDGFPDKKSKGVFVIQTSTGEEILCSHWEANVVWRLV